MKRLFTILTLALAVMAASASTAKFNRIWIETNADHDGEKGVMIHADFNINNAKDKTVQCQAIFYATPGGRALRDINDRFRLSPSLNYVSASSYFKAKSGNYEISDLEVFIPTEELHLKNPRKYRIYVKVSVYTNPGKTGEFLTESDYIPFIVDMSNLSGAGERFYYDPTKPIVVPELPKADSDSPQPKVDKPANNDEPELDKKGRPKRKKGKVFIS